LYVGLVIANADDIGLFEVGTSVTAEHGALTPGRRIVVTASAQNPLAPGRHFVRCGVQSSSGISLFVPNAFSFIVFGTQQMHGIIAPEFEIEAALEGSELG
jgi:hypothetical protein